MVSERVEGGKARIATLALSAYGRSLTKKQAKLLLSLNKPATSTELADSLNDDVANVRRTLKTLIERGLIEKYRFNREVEYFRTKKGKMVTNAVLNR